jgi:hypothetical protein
MLETKDSYWVSGRVYSKSLGVFAVGDVDVDGTSSLQTFHWRWSAFLIPSEIVAGVVEAR